MRTVHIYAGTKGWFYEVWIASRVIVLGWSATREHAEVDAALA